MKLFHLLQADPSPISEEPSFAWLPEKMSSNAEHIDPWFWFIMWTCVFFFVLIVGLMTYFCVKYRRKDESEPPGEGSTHNTPLEVTWTVIPLILAFVMFYVGVDGFVELSTPPPDSYEINVTAASWSWNFRYPNGVEHNELHCWVGQPFHLKMRSTGVLHAISIPAFRVKQDIVPGRYTETWFEPYENAVGTHRLYCAEYCGQDHSSMTTYVTVHRTREDFEEWAAKAGVRNPEEDTKAEWGEKLYKRKGCQSCHSVESPDEEGWQGPSWVNTANLMATRGEREFSDGSRALVDENYIVQSILLPKAKIVKGFELGNMPPANLSGDDLDSIIAYIKTLRTVK